MPVAAAPLIIGGIQAGIGAIQRRASKRRREKAMEALDYDIPSGITEQVQLAKERASRTGLPGEDVTRSRVDSDIAEAVSKGETVAQTSSDVLGLYQNMYGNKMDMNRQILEKGAQYKSENELQLMKSMGLMAEAENQQFYYNKMVPFLSDMQYAGEQAQGGSANIAGGFQTAYQGWMNNFMTQQFKEQQPPTGDMDFGRNKLNNIAESGKAQIPPWQTDLNVPTTELNPWVDPKNPYNMGRPDRDQLNRPGVNNNYGQNYSAY